MPLCLTLFAGCDKKEKEWVERATKIREQIKSNMEVIEDLNNRFATIWKSTDDFDKTRDIWLQDGTVKLGLEILTLSMPYHLVYTKTLQSDKDA